MSTTVVHQYVFGNQKNNNKGRKKRRKKERKGIMVEGQKRGRMREGRTW